MRQMKNQLAQGHGDSRGDTREVQQAEGTVRSRRVADAEPARRRAAAVVLDRRVGAVIATRLQHEAGRVLGIDRDKLARDPFARHRGEQAAPERIGADAAQVADLEPEPGQIDRDVQLGAGGALLPFGDCLQRRG